MTGIWVVEATEISCPFLVPGACPIRHRIVSARLLTDPKNRGNDTFFPWIPFSLLRRCGMLGREQKGTNIAQKIVWQFVRFFTGLNIGRLRLCWRRVRDKRRDRRQHDRDCARNGSGFHFASVQRNPEKKTSCLLYSSFTMTRMRANRGEFQIRRNRVTQSQGSSGLVNKFLGFRIPCGSNACLSLRCSSRTTFVVASGRQRFFARPIPCSPGYGNGVRSKRQRRCR